MLLTAERTSHPDGYPTFDSDLSRNHMRLIRRLFVYHLSAHFSWRLQIVAEYSQRCLFDLEVREPQNSLHLVTFRYPERPATLVWL